jgi:hypothetical protein
MKKFNRSLLIDIFMAVKARLQAASQSVANFGVR